MIIDIQEVGVWFATVFLIYHKLIQLPWTVYCKAGTAGRDIGFPMGLSAEHLNGITPN